MAYESTPARLAIREKLVDALLAVSVQGLITHQEIARVIGKTTSSPDALKHSAFRVAESDHGVVFENIRGAGYRRIAAGEVHRVGVQARHSIRRKAKSGTKKIVAVLTGNSNSMTSKERVLAHAELGMLGMIKMATGRGSASRAQETAQKHQDEHGRPPAQDEIARLLMRRLAGKSAA